MNNWITSLMPLQASTHAGEIDQMTILVHWLMLVLFIGWGAYFLLVLVKFRRGANARADYAGAKGKVAKGSEILVAIIEIVLLVAYAIPAWAMRVRPMPADPRAIVVRVVGVLAAFASFFVYLMRRARMVAQHAEETAR